MSASKFYFALVGGVIGMLLLFILTMPPLIYVGRVWGDYWLKPTITCNTDHGAKYCR